jgi:hypothetical protein
MTAKKTKPQLGLHIDVETVDARLMAAHPKTISAYLKTAEVVKAKRVTVESIVKQANEPKHRLMGLVVALRHEGCARKAQALDNIIGRLEAWQNTQGKIG